MTQRRRDFTEWLGVIPTTTGRSPYVAVEQPNENTPWLIINSFAISIERTQQLFPNGAHVGYDSWKEFRNYVRQARVYWDAARTIKGASASLPYYYAALNLAKAELLQHDAQSIVGRPIKHGLSFNPAGTPSVFTDNLVVYPGVFPMLVKARTGVEIEPGTKLQVGRMLSQLNEIGLEVESIGRNRPRPRGCQTIVAQDGTEAWAVVAVQGGEPEEPLLSHLKRGFREVIFPDKAEWKMVFGLSTRLPLHLPTFYESKTTYSQDSMPDVRAAAFALRRLLIPFLDDSHEVSNDALLRQGLWKSKDDPLSLFLIRYAVMYYLSSVVRYKPSALDPYANGLQAWLMDSVAYEVPPRLLLGCLTGMSGRPIRWEPGGFRS